VGFTNLLFLFRIRRNCLRSRRSRSLYLSIRRAIKQTVVIIGAYHFCQVGTKFILLSRLIPYADEIIWEHQCEFRHNRATTDHKLILCIRHILKKKWKYNEAVRQLFIDFTKLMIQLRGRCCVIFSFSFVSI